MRLAIGLVILVMLICWRFGVDPRPPKHAAGSSDAELMLGPLPASELPADDDDVPPPSTQPTTAPANPQTSIPLAEEARSMTPLL